MRPINLGGLAAAILTLAALDPASARSGQAKPYAPPTDRLAPRVQRHVDQAYLALNGAISDEQIPSQLTMIDAQAFPPFARVVNGKVELSPPKPELPATKVFDQLYYLGDPLVSAWALDTSEGIILIDSLQSGAEAERLIEGGLRSLGLDPARIKYIVVTHVHGDHYGGAKHLQDRYKARVLMSKADWDVAPVMAPLFAEHYGPTPTRDMEVVDGQSLTLGQTTIRFYVTPGHTPGPLSMIFTVTDQGRPHVVSFFGGTGLQTIDRDPAKGGFAVMRASLQRFAKLSLDAGADVILSNHPFTDGAYAKVAAQRAGRPGSTQPWVAGPDAVLRFYVAFIEMTNAVEAFYEENPAARAEPRRTP